MLDVNIKSSYSLDRYVNNMMPTTSEVTQLNALRLANNWSFDRLVDDMRMMGAIVTKSGIYRLIAEERRPHATTLYQIQCYLTARRRSGLDRKRTGGGKSR